jgi:hypothetical protein
MGDTNLDNRVDAADLNKLGLNWQRITGCLTWSDGDLDGNRTIDPIDLNFIGVNWLANVARARIPRAALAASSQS